ncbi:MAG TPA: TIGR03435 family protein [Bryobacteraceae bacterium]|nr:TIGR03435 family protein [Bryobacteraceae bacterium]
MKTRIFRLLVLVCLSAALGISADAPVFEVATIKPGDPASRGMSISLGVGGMFTTKNVTLKMLVALGWNVREFQISGASGWIGTDRFDIVAKPEHEVQRNSDEGRALLRAMVQSLLADRFHLQVHTESKEMQVYALIVAKNGSKLVESDPESKGPSLGFTGNRGGRSSVTASKVSMKMFAEALSNQLGRTVIDQTGLNSSYTFKMEYTPDLEMGPTKPGLEAEKVDTTSLPDGPTIFTALTEQLGLKLDSQKGPVEVVVIDHAEKPTDN